MDLKNLAESVYETANPVPENQYEMKKAEYRLKSLKYLKTLVRERQTPANRSRMNVSGTKNELIERLLVDDFPPLNAQSNEMHSSLSVVTTDVFSLNVQHSMSSAMIEEGDADDEETEDMEEENERVHNELGLQTQVDSGWQAYQQQSLDIGTDGQYFRVNSEANGNKNERGGIREETSNDLGSQTRVDSQYQAYENENENEDKDELQRVDLSYMGREATPDVLNCSQVFQESEEIDYFGLPK